MLTKLSEMEFMRLSRLARRISQRQLGDKLGISGAWIGMLERGEWQANSETLSRLRAILQPEELGISLT